MSSSQKIDNELILRGKIKCRHCGESSLLVQWDLATKNNCITREQRRAYISLEQERAYRGKYVYECPKCKRVTEGKQINVYLD